MDTPPGESACCLALHEAVKPAEYLLVAEICMLGRAPECQIVVSLSIVSRLHAQIERDGSYYLLRDTGSANGTFVNQHPIARPHRLTHCDIIGLGAATPLLRFLDPRATFELAELLRYDEQAGQFFVERQPVNLTPAQLRLLAHVYQHAGTICTYESCTEAIWGRQQSQPIDRQALDEVVSAVRRKLREHDPMADCIMVRRGLGYELVL